MSTQRDIDSILDEIDNKEGNKASEISNDQIAKRIKDTLYDIIGMPLIKDYFDRKLNRETWLLLFHTQTQQQIQKLTSTKKEQNSSHKSNKKQANYNMSAPFAKYCNDITKEELLEIYDEIPKSITNSNDIDYVHEEKLLDLGIWIIKYKNDVNNTKHKQAMQKIYDGIIRYVYWIMFYNIVTKEYSSVGDAVKFYRKYHEYIDINQQWMSNGWTVK